MAQSYREIVKNDQTLIGLLKIVENHSLDGHDKFSIDDFENKCVKVSTIINTKNPDKYSRRIAWILTGRLLFGLTVYHGIQVQNCLDESLKLLQQCGRQIFLINKPKALKRKTKEAITGPKNKRNFTVEDNEDVEQAQFWEIPLEMNTHETTAPDLCLVPAHQITLADIEEPLIFNIEKCYDLEDETGLGEKFGNVDQMVLLDVDVDEIASFGGNSSGNISRLQNTSFDFDENMNDILPIEINLENILSEIEENSTRPENLLTLMTNNSSLESLAINSKPKKRKRRHTLFQDSIKVIPGDVMTKRIENPNIDCKSRNSDIFSQEKRFKLQSKIDFEAPIMNGIVSRELFTRNAKKLVHSSRDQTDWTIIEDAFYSASNEFNGESIEPNEIEVLQNESMERRKTRSQSGMSFSHPLRTSTPIKQSQENVPFDAPQTQQKQPETMQVFEFDPPEAIFFTPPLNFQDDIISPAPGFENNQNNPELPNPSQQLDLVPFNAESIESPQIECADLATVLGDDSLELEIMKKLLKLWQKNIHPIKVENLLSARCNRFQAAKTFSSLLTLKKKKLIQLENSDDGKITHISKEADLNESACVHNE